MDNCPFILPFYFIEISILYIANIDYEVVLLVRVGDSFNMMKILLVMLLFYING
jgi:hypothetical protein